MKCKFCGKDFEPQTKRDKYCCKECAKAGKKARQSKYYAEKNEAKREQKPKIACRICGKMFVPGRGGNKVCSDKCREEWIIIKAHDYYEQVVKPRRDTKEKPTSAKGSNAKDSAVKERVCLECGKTFLATYQAAICSNECRKVREARRRKEYYDSVIKPHNVAFSAAKKVKEQALKERQEREIDAVYQPETDAKPLDGKVLHKAQMTVDEYNKAHGTNYSYGQYVYYVESKGV